MLLISLNFKLLFLSFQLYDKNGIVELANEFRDLDVFFRVLKVNDKR